jgi:hypothetical protein
VVQWRWQACSGVGSATSRNGCSVLQAAGSGSVTRGRGQGSACLEPATQGSQESNRRCEVARAGKRIGERNPSTD